MLLTLKPQITKEQIQSLLLEVPFPVRAACLCPELYLVVFEGLEGMTYG